MSKTSRVFKERFIKFALLLLKIITTGTKMNERFIDTNDDPGDYSPYDDMDFKNKRQWVWLENALAVIAFGHFFPKPDSRFHRRPVGSIAVLNYTSPIRPEETFCDDLIQIIAGLEHHVENEGISLTECYLAGIPSTPGFREHVDLAAGLAEDTYLELRLKEMHSKHPVYVTISPQDKSLIYSSNINWESYFKRLNIKA
jgi:hypothetical protein